MKYAETLIAVGDMVRIKEVHREVQGWGVTTEKAAARMWGAVDFVLSCLEV